MAIWAKIKQLELSQLFVLAKTFLFKPRLILPTYKATKNTVEICNKLYGKAHHKDNQTNAFRHALWNFKIAEASLPEVKQRDKAIAWAEEITNLHERLSPNPILPQTMDLHNNKIGRQLFLQEIPPDFIIKKLQVMMKDAKQISMAKEAALYPLQLVFIKPLKN